MKKNFLKNAFTLVELLVVIAILAVLSAVAIVGYSSFTARANISNDGSLIKELNDYVKALSVTEDFETVEEVRVAISEDTIDLSTATPFASKIGYHYGFNLKTKQFTYLDDVNIAEGYSTVGEKEDTFVLVKNEADALKYTEAGYSVYLQKGFDGTELTIKAGLDAGVVKSLNKINYDRKNETASKEVVIRTNGGTLTINAPKDEVTHFGNADYVDIIAVKPASYEENGTVSLVKVAKGNVALTSDAKVGQIHLAKTGNEFTEIKITLENGAKLPDLSRDSVGTTLTGEVLVCEVASEQSSEFYWLSGNGTIEDEQVLVSTTADGNKTAATSENSTAVAIANAKTGEEVTDTGKTLKPASEMDEDELIEATAGAAAKTFAEIGNKEELIAFRDAWNAGKLSSGTFKLTANIIDISDEPWSPIGNQAYPFTGTFDGNDKTISGLSNNGYSIDINDVFTTDYSKATGAPYGLFGVVGSKDDNNASVTIKNLKLTNVHIENDKFNCVGAVIGGDVSAIKDKDNHYINDSYAGDIQLTNITVSGEKVYGLDGVGGLIGKVYTQGNVEVTGCTSSIDVYAVASENKKVAAVVGYANGGASYNISGNTISGNVYVNTPTEGLLDQVANIKKVQLSYVFGVGDNTCTNKLYLLENNEYVEYKMPYVISHERDGNGNVTRSVITFINQAEPDVKYIPDNRQDLCDGTLVLNMNDSIYGHRFLAYNTLTGSIEFRNCTIGTGMSDLQFKNTTSVLFKDCDIVCGNSIYMIVSGGSLTLDLGTHTCHRTVQICKGGSNANDQICPAGTSIYVVSGTFTNTIYNHGQENGVIYIQGGLFTFVESQYGINKISGRGNDAFVITGGTFNKTYGTSGNVNISNYIPSTHQFNEENNQYVVVAK